MKVNIHPRWFKKAKISCACGNVFYVGSTKSQIDVDVCSLCHPFYTGQMKYLDTAGRVESFNIKMSQASKKLISKSEKRKLKQDKRIKEEMSRPDSLSALRSHTT